MKIAILGAGWFGSHIAKHLLLDGHDVTVFERKGVFAGASGQNQDRVHQGFHYPRSAKTRKEIRHCHDRFVKEYPTVGSVGNFYAIARRSLIDFETYVAICKSANLSFWETPAGVVGNPNTIDGAVLTRERIVDTLLVKGDFEMLLTTRLRIGEQHIEVLRTAVMVNGERFDCMVNCTNLRLADVALPIYYEAAMIINLKGPLSHPSLTVMDGPDLPALLETPVPGEYTLSNVKLTAIAKCPTWNEAEDALNAVKWEDRAEAFMDSMAEFLPDFKKNFTPVGARKAVRTKPINGTDSRECLTHTRGRIMSVVCGKFMSVFIAEERVKEWISQLP